MEDFIKEKESALYQDFEKEAEKEREASNLAEIIKLINEEILKYVDKRKYIYDYITDYRKSVIEEYRDDEDKIVEYFDHERFVKEEAFRTIDRRLKELVILVNAPYFGRVGFIEEGSDIPESINIGRFGMTPDGSYEPVVVDWRAPISALFYSGKLGKSFYQAPVGKVEADILSKRQFVIKKGKLSGMFDSAVDVKDEILQMVLMANSSEKLKDIIMTIQEEQDRLIRQHKNKTIIVNGVAGSGKTTIALHRVAYLLYNYRESLQDKVLILGPNNIFMEYISTVLPNLGEADVKQKTFTDFALEILNIDDLMPYREYIEKIFIKDEALIKDIMIKNSEGYLKDLDEEIENMDKLLFHIEGVEFRNSIVVAKEEIEEMFNTHFKYMPLFRRSKKIKRIIFNRLKDARDDIVREIDREYKELVEKLTKGQEQSDITNLQFIRRNKIREVIKDLIMVKEEMTWINNPELLDIYKGLNGEKTLILDDLAPLLYMKHRLEGVKLKEEIKHVVIDEAQDYSLLQFKVIKELTKCISLTIVGDVNQRIMPIEGELPLLALKNTFSDLDIEYFHMEKSYRSTREIMEYANKYLTTQKIVPLVRNGEAVVERSFSLEKELVEYIESLVVELKGKGFESIAVVCRDLKAVYSFENCLKPSSHIKMINQEDSIYRGGVVLLPSYFAKGLEFDVVIVVDKEEQRDQEDDKIKYIMCTRALHQLYSFSY